MTEPRATPEREQAEAQLKRALSVLDDKDPRNWCATARSLAHDVVDLAAAVSRLEAERDEALNRVRNRHEDVRKACAHAETAYQARDAVEAQVEALVERERELTRALAEARLWVEDAQSRYDEDERETGGYLAAVDMLASIDAALAGGVSAAPPEQDLGGNAVAVAEAGRDAAPIKLPVTLSSHPKDKPRLGLAFTYEGEEWTVTESYWREGLLYGLAHRADGLGDWREVTADELTAMLASLTTETAEQSNQEVAPAVPEVLPRGDAVIAALDVLRHRIPSWWWLTYDALVGVVIVVGVRPWSPAFWLGFSVLGIAVVIDAVEFIVKRPSAVAKLAAPEQTP